MVNVFKKRQKTSKIYSIVEPKKSSFFKVEFTDGNMQIGPKSRFFCHFFAHLPFVKTNQKSLQIYKL